jgi:hypothetical protein
VVVTGPVETVTLCVVCASCWRMLAQAIGARAGEKMNLYQACAVRVARRGHTCLDAICGCVICGTGVSGSSDVRAGELTRTAATAAAAVTATVALMRRRRCAGSVAAADGEVGCGSRVQKAKAVSAARAARAMRAWRQAHRSGFWLGVMARKRRSRMAEVSGGADGGAGAEAGLAAASAAAAAADDAEADAHLR